MAASAVLEAEGLEAEAQEWPDQRGEILLEAAVAWRRAGQRDRATRLLLDLASEGGEDGCYAGWRPLGHPRDEPTRP